MVSKRLGWRLVICRVRSQMCHLHEQLAAAAGSMKLVCKFYIRFGFLAWVTYMLLKIDVIENTSLGAKCCL